MCVRSRSCVCHLQKICDLRGWPAGSDKNTETHEVMLKIWEGLRSKADKDNDGQVSTKFCRSNENNNRCPVSPVDWNLSSLDLKMFMNFYYVRFFFLPLPSSLALALYRNAAEYNYKNCYYKLLLSTAQKAQKCFLAKHSVYPFLLIFYCYGALTW